MLGRTARSATGRLSSATWRGAQCEAPGQSSDPDGSPRGPGAGLAAGSGVPCTCPSGSHQRVIGMASKTQHRNLQRCLATIQGVPAEGAPAEGTTQTYECAHSEPRELPKLTNAS